MSELLHRNPDNLTLVCGTVELEINFSFLDETLKNTSCYTELASPYFDPETKPHISSAEFGVEVDEHDHGLYAKGHISYRIQETQNKELNSRIIATRLLRFLQSQANLLNHEIKQDADELIIKNSTDGKIAVVYVQVDPVESSEATITIEDDYSYQQIDSNDTLMPVVIWGHVCDFVVRLGTGKRALFTDEWTTCISVGQVVDYPSDIEVAIVQEIEERRLRIGSIATMPWLDDDTISSKSLQDLALGTKLTPQAIDQIATSIVDEKRRNYVELDIMTNITGKDIEKAVRSHVSDET